jgi:hypothetical protein
MFGAGVVEAGVAAFEAPGEGVAGLDLAGTGVVGEGVPGTGVGELDEAGAGDGGGSGGGGGVRSGHEKTSPVVPPSSSRNIVHRSRHFGRSGTPNGLSAVPGKTMYVTFRSLTGRLMELDRLLMALQMRMDASPIL